MIKKRTPKNQEGAAAVEFAIILPLFIVLVFGIIEFSLAFYDKAMITNASREGARRGIVYTTDPDATVSNAEIESVVTAYLSDNLITFGPDTDVDVAIAREGFAPGDDLSVTVTYSYGYLLLPAFIDAISGPINLTARTVMRME